MNIMTDFESYLEQIMQQIRDLRDADFHVCPADLDDSQVLAVILI